MADITDVTLLQHALHLSIKAPGILPPLTVQRIQAPAKGQPKYIVIPVPTTGSGTGSRLSEGGYNRRSAVQEDEEEESKVEEEGEELEFIVPLAEASPASVYLYDVAEAEVAPASLTPASLSHERHSRIAANSKTSSKVSICICIFPYVLTKCMYIYAHIYVHMHYHDVSKSILTHSYLPHYRTPLLSQSYTASSQGRSGLDQASPQSPSRPLPRCSCYRSTDTNR